MGSSGYGKQGDPESWDYFAYRRWDTPMLLEVDPAKMGENDDGDGFDQDEVIDVRSEEITQIKAKSPRMYKVILHNDDYTTMDFVVEILVSVFIKTAAEATKIMLDVHRRGSGICGIFIRDIAETKVHQVHHLARENQFPLRCRYEEA